MKMKEIYLVHILVNFTKRQNRPQIRQIRAVMKAKFKSVILSLCIFLNLTYSDRRSDQHIVQVSIAFFTAGCCMSKVQIAQYIVLLLLQTVCL